MKKQTTRQRIEQAVEQYVQDGAGFINIVDPTDAVKLILAERRRIKDQVRNLSEKAHFSMYDYQQIGYVKACDDILARLRG